MCAFSCWCGRALLSASLSLVGTCSIVLLVSVTLWTCYPCPLPPLVLLQSRPEFVLAYVNAPEDDADRDTLTVAAPVNDSGVVLPRQCFIGLPYSNPSLPSVVTITGPVDVSGL